MLKLLIVVAEPEGEDRIDLDLDVRAIMDEIAKSAYRDQVQLKMVVAARPRDVINELTDFKPTLVHFTGHGNKHELVLLNPMDDLAVPVSAQSVSKLINGCPSVRVIVFSACYSDSLASAALSSTDAAIGFKQDVFAPASVAFSSSFYRAILAGESLKSAFEKGCLAMEMEGYTEAEQIALQSNVNADEYVLVKHQEPATSCLELDWKTVGSQMNPAAYSIGFFLRNAGQVPAKNFSVEITPSQFPKGQWYRENEHLGDRIRSGHTREAGVDQFRFYANANEVLLPGKSLHVGTYVLQDLTTKPQLELAYEASAHDNLTTGTLLIKISDLPNRI